PDPAHRHPEPAPLEVRPGDLVADAVRGGVEVALVPPLGDHADHVRIVAVGALAVLAGPQVLPAGGEDRPAGRARGADEDVEPEGEDGPGAVPEADAGDAAPALLDDRVGGATDVVPRPRQLHAAVLVGQPGVLEHLRVHVELQEWGVAALWRRVDLAAERV